MKNVPNVIIFFTFDRGRSAFVPVESLSREASSEFLKRFVEATRKWKVGVPSDPSANMGALISKAHLEKVSGSLPSTLRKVLN